MEPNVFSMWTIVIPAAFSAVCLLLSTAYVAHINSKTQIRLAEIANEVKVVKVQTDGMQSDLKKAIEGKAFGEGIKDERDRQEVKADKAAEVVKEAAATVATAADTAATVLKIAAGSAGARIPVETVADLEAKKAKAAEGKA